MSMNIYAGRHEDHPEYGQIMSPVVDFNCWDQEIVAQDADARADRGESAFIPNPDYIADGGLNLSNTNAETLMRQLGFAVDAPSPVISRSGTSSGPHCGA